MKESFELEPLDQELESALSRFRASAHAWSAQEYARISSMPLVASSRGWGAIFRWVVAVCFAIAIVTVPLHRERVRQAKVQAVITAQEDTQLLEDVDTDVSRQVPASMSPLTSLIASDESGSEQLANSSTRQGETQP